MIEPAFCWRQFMNCRSGRENPSKAQQSTELQDKYQSLGRQLKFAKQSTGEEWFWGINLQESICWSTFIFDWISSFSKKFEILWNHMKNYMEEYQLWRNRVCKFEVEHTKLEDCQSTGWNCHFQPVTVKRYYSSIILHLP